MYYRHILLNKWCLTISFLVKIVLENRKIYPSIVMFCSHNPKLAEIISKLVIFRVFNSSFFTYIIIYDTTYIIFFHFL